jgi:hypothetical protein
MATRRLQHALIYLDQTIALVGGDDGLRARTLFNGGYLAFWKGEYDRSSAYQKEAVALARTAGHATVLALALVGLARIALRTDFEEARRLCRQAL